MQSLGIATCKPKPEKTTQFKLNKKRLKPELGGKLSID
jgi:hypothetical protein